MNTGLEVPVTAVPAVACVIVGAMSVMGSAATSDALTQLLGVVEHVEVA
ncbi:hypothetical protein [uncultured Microbacterium sp.]